MRIGIFTDSYPPFINGVSTSIKMLEKALTELGNEVFIVTVNPDNMKLKYENNGKIIRLPGIKVGIYDYRVTGAYSVRVINKIKKWNLDVIHSQTEFGVGTFARVISKQFNIPIVHTYHTFYEDYIYYITKGYFDKTSKKIVKSLTDFYCDKTIDELIVPTQKIYDIFKEKYNYDKDINIIPTGLEIENFSKENFSNEDILNLKEKCNLKNDDIVLLLLGRVAREKNIEFLINCMPNYDNVKLIIIGDGPDIDYYKKLAENKNNISFLGKVPYENVPIYYQLADVFVTSSKSETQGLTVIEALASSLPVLAINDESFNKVIKNGVNGYIFNDENEYKEILNKIIVDKSILNNMKVQARKSSLEYSSSIFAKRVLEVYEKAIEKNNNKTIFSIIKNKFNDE